ncbi:hypothetical protein [Nocardia testacea]|uniref:Uncharacterized protein n=1 Tax=Nocardia testacea TaxID=248551 RepID=A0ABW7VXD4_9NOCA
MFESWCDEFSAPLRRVAEPPIPVLVNLSIVLAPGPGFRRDAVSMLTKSAGLDTSATVPGLLHAWARTSTGTWIGFVRFAIPAANRQGWIEARQWCPAHALVENNAGEGVPPHSGR